MHRGGRLPHPSCFLWALEQISASLHLLTRPGGTLLRSCQSWDLLPESKLKEVGPSGLHALKVHGDGVTRGVDTLILARDCIVLVFPAQLEIGGLPGASALPSSQPSSYPFSLGALSQEISPADENIS